MSHALTVLICTHDRAQLLERVLESLDRAERPAAMRVEVLVVANACSDGTHELLRHRREHAPHGLPLRWCAEPLPGKSKALNRGRAEAAGDWVAVVDDDHRVAPDFLVQIVRALQSHRDATMLCGRILPDWTGTEPQWIHDPGRYPIYPLPIPRQDFGAESRELREGGPIPGGGNHIISRAALARVGEFCTELGPQGHDLSGGEDTEYMLRALRSGERLWYEPAILQYHYVDTARLALPYLLKKAYSRSASGVIASGGRGTVPLYLYRKLASYSFAALSAWNSARRRYYLVRCAAALGEMRAWREQARQPRSMPGSPTGS